MITADSIVGKQSLSGFLDGEYLVIDTAKSSFDATTVLEDPTGKFFQDAFLYSKVAKDADALYRVISTKFREFAATSGEGTMEDTVKAFNDAGKFVVVNLTTGGVENFEFVYSTSIKKL